MTAFLAPDPIQSIQLIPGGIVPAAGGLLFCYQAGTSTKLNTYTDPTASTARANPIVLDSGGNIPGNGEVWITSTAKFVLAPFNDSDPPVSPYWTRDNYSGINNITSQLAATEWVVGPSPTFVSTTSFTLVGDQTAIFTPGRRVKTTNTAGTRYGTISTSVFGAVTTVTITNDSGTLDSGLSAVWYALINPVNTSLPLIVSVLNFGAKGDGVTDDTAAIQAAITAIQTAGGGTVYFPHGAYIVGGALQDTGRANAQILLPSISIFTPFQQLTIELRGESPPPASPGVNLGTTALPAGGTIIKGTLNTGAGGSLIGVEGPAASGSNFSNIQVKLKDLMIRLPSNPIFTAVNLKWAAASELDNVSVDSGSYDVPAIPLPTTATSYAIRTPGAANGGVNRLKDVTVVGYYNGIEVGEHFYAHGQIAAYGCLNAVTFAASSFQSSFEFLMLVHCQNGLTFTTTQYVEIGLLSLEHAADATWMVPGFDINDAGNGANGALVWGPSTATLLVSGGIGLKTTQVGSEMAVWATHTPTVTAGTGTFTSVVGTTRWKRDGKQIFFSTKINITTNGTAATSVIFTLPITAQGTLIQMACGRASGVSGFALQVQIVTTTASIRNYDNSYPGANGEQLNVSGVYEAA